ncbi:hypothetical protein BN2497_11595 [Janthinobacterium sp. CG23_2]|nr:hypothetical protein BN2497_11595 [Janthinobacterium sp. CG23_2]CUU32195.1 hypothetical protein BN3177_11595 [Janthinobacterium sp. CG23_2]
MPPAARAEHDKKRDCEDAAHARAHGENTGNRWMIEHDLYL